MFAVPSVCIVTIVDEKKRVEKHWLTVIVDETSE